jgi:hypothetical protein
LETSRNGAFARRRDGFARGRRGARVIGAAALGMTAALANGADAAALDDGDGADAWSLQLDGEQRTRYQSLNHDYRAGKSAFSDDVLTERTLLGLRLHRNTAALGSLTFFGQLQDARAQSLSGRIGQVPLSSSLINPIDLLQAYLRWRQPHGSRPSARYAVQFGRFRMALGSRRLISGTPFRNTFNAYTGLRVDRFGRGGSKATAFATVPVQRRPTTRSGLEDNEAIPDLELWHTLFAGAIARTAPLALDFKLEGYAYVLDEHDSPRAQTRNRRLLTPGLRLFRPSRPGHWRSEVEVIGQIGSDRASTAPSDTRDLRHRAYALHASIGYRFRAPLTPQLDLDYDLASGDRNPADGRDERFDSLFIGRRYDLGPTDLWGAVTRANLRSPGLRLTLHLPHGDLFVIYRRLWLDQSRDAWTPAKVRDPTGASGRDLGQQIDSRLRYTLIPRRLKFEAGYTVLLRGRFARQAPGGAATDSSHVYVEFTLSF